MQVDKNQFDVLLGKLLKAAPAPKSTIKVAKPKPKKNRKFERVLPDPKH